MFKNMYIFYKYILTSTNHLKSMDNFVSVHWEINLKTWYLPKTGDICFYDQVQVINAF